MLNAQLLSGSLSRLVPVPIPCRPVLLAYLLETFQKAWCMQGNARLCFHDLLWKLVLRAHHYDMTWYFVCTMLR